VVEAAGAAVTSYRTGDRVFGLSASTFGAHAEYICVPEHGSIAMKPLNMSFEEAAAVCDGMMLGWNYVKEIDFSTPKAILVNGADGSIGSACLQLAKHFGAAVTAVCKSKDVALMKQLGADAVIDYTRDDFTRDGRLYDAVIDAVGKSSFSRCRRLLKPGGVYYSSELGFGVQNVFLAMLTPLLRGRKVGFPLPKDTQKDILFFKELIEAGRYRAVIDRRYTLEEIVEATKYVETGQKTGNVVVTVS
jgi:NADPH:quinone reductase-like Zn-dependent oxidoreductase